MMIAMLRILAAMLVFAGIFVGCVATLLLVILLVRFPPLLIAALLACWILNRLMKTADK